MCELFGISSAKKYPANDCLSVFYSHSQRHPHGWGLLTVSGGEFRMMKEDRCALSSERLQKRLSCTVSGEVVMAHIRYATIGNVEYENCHPFCGCDNTGKHWALMHNGTIFDYPPLRRYLWEQKGQTDSERIFLYLLDQISAAQKQKGASLTFEESFSLLETLITDMAKGNKLNLLFTDGTHLFVHTNCRHTLYYLPHKDSILFSTTPLTQEAWREVPFARLMAFSQGRKLTEGTPHQNEYLESADATKMLYRIFADL